MLLAKATLRAPAHEHVLRMIGLRASDEWDAQLARRGSRAIASGEHVNAGSARGKSAAQDTLNAFVDGVLFGLLPRLAFRGRSKRGERG